MYQSLLKSINLVSFTVEECIILLLKLKRNTKRKTKQYFPGVFNNILVNSMVSLT